MTFPKPEVDFSFSFISLWTLPALLPLTFKRTPMNRKSSRLFLLLTFHQHLKANNPVSQGEASWPCTEPSGAVGCFPVHGKKKDLSGTLSCSRGFSLQRMYQAGDTHLPLGPGRWPGGKLSDPLPIHTADSPQTGRTDKFSFSWHQPKRALKGGMG